jgi:diguanylate cyclase (GGDEF)-like protein
MAFRRPFFTFYVGLVIVAGALLFPLLYLSDETPGAFLGTATFWVFTVLVVAAEQLPLRIPRGDREGELTVSTTFAFALLLLSGPTAGAVALGLATAIADVRQRKSAWKVLFNVAQYGLAIAAASVVVEVTGTWYAGQGSLDVIGVVTGVLAGTTFAIVNSLEMAALVSTASRSTRDGLAPVTLAEVLRGDASFLVWSYTVLVSLGPIVALTAEASLWAVPLFVVPTAGVYQSVSIYLDRQRHALHDSLTNLPNRALFEDRVLQAVAGAHRGGSRAAVLVLDVDQFKEVNSQLGFRVGDRLLTELARRLVSVVRETDTIARLGADEFGAVLAGLPDFAAAEGVVTALRDAVAQPFVFGTDRFVVEASVGGALYPEDGSDPRALIRAADEAMDEAKQNRYGHRWYSAQQGQVAGRMRLLAELRAALDGGDLELHYQPKAALQTGRISGVEALVRWRRGGTELVAPSEFIPVAEQTGLMGSITRYVLDEAIAQMRQWRDAGHQLHVAVNISARDLQDPMLANDIGALLERHGVSASDLELEITESSIMADIDQAVAMLTHLHDMGISLAIDDFGTGNTSLAQLPRLPIDVLKIDRSFVRRLESGPDDLIVRTTIELGRGLGLSVVAEGVSNETVWRRLAALGCDYAQGYYLSRPVQAREVKLLLGPPTE